MNKETLSPYTTPREVKDIVARDRFLSSCKQIHEVSPVSGGVAHHVYRVRTDSDIFYLKIRGNRFAQMPEIACNPVDICNEKKALMVFNEISPENFPRILSFNEEKFYMILTNALPNGELLQDLLLKGDISESMLFNLGGTLKNIHQRSMFYQQDIRKNGDSQHYEKKLSQRKHSL